MSQTNTLTIESPVPFNTHISGCPFARKAIWVACCIVLLSFLQEPSQGQTSKTPNGVSKLLGQWKAIGTIREGQFSPSKGDCIYSFEEEAFKISEAGKRTTTIAYSIDARQSPKHFDARLGNEQAKMIYGFDSDRLWISHSLPGSARPGSILDDDDHLSILVFRPMQGNGHVQPSKLDVIFDHCYGNRGFVDLERAKALTLEAEKTQQPTALAWAAFARRYNMAGFENEFSEKHKFSFQGLVPQLEHQANSGNVEAKFLLGLATYHGFAVEADDQLSEKYLREAASQGHSPSAYWLGRALPAPKAKEALNWLKLCAAFGNGEAMSTLGFIYYDGFGIPSDKAEALQWYSASAQRKCSYGMFGLGYMIEKREPQRAFGLFEQAAAMNHPFAFSKLGDCFHYGTGCPKNLQKAIDNYLKAIDHQKVSSAYELGKLYLDQEEYSKAIEAFEWADGMGHLPSTTSLGICYEKGWGRDIDISIAKAMYKKAAKQGSEDAKQQLARLEPKPRRRSSFNSMEYDYGSSSNASWEQNMVGARETATRAANRARRDFQRQLLNRGL